MSTNSKIEFSLFRDCAGSICSEAFDILVSNIDSIKKNILASSTFGKIEQINIVLSDTSTIKEMNSEFRDMDRVTDVLAFNVDSELGEVWICPQYIKNSAENSDVNFDEEILRVTIHGILHVLGYDHEEYFGEKNDDMQEEMYKIQEKVLKSII